MAVDMKPIGKSRLMTVLISVLTGIASFAPPAAGAPVDPAVLAYQGRAATVLQGNLSALKSWAAANAAVTDNVNTGSLSIWTAAAGFAQAHSDPTALPAARKLAAGLMEYRVLHLFGGGNDGWPAWATADTRVRFGSLITSDTEMQASSNTFLQTFGTCR